MYTPQTWHDAALHPRERLLDFSSSQDLALLCGTCPPHVVIWDQIAMPSLSSPPVHRCHCCGVLVPAFPCVCRHHRYHHHLCQHHQWQHPSSHRSKQDCCRRCCGPPPRRRDRCCDCWCCCGGGCLPCCCRLPFVRLGYAFLLDPLIYKPTCLGRLRDHKRFLGSLHTCRTG